MTASLHVGEQIFGSLRRTIPRLLGDNNRVT